MAAFTVSSAQRPQVSHSCVNFGKFSKTVLLCVYCTTLGKHSVNLNKVSHVVSELKAEDNWWNSRLELSSKDKDICCSAGHQTLKYLAGLDRLPHGT